MGGRADLSVARSVRRRTLEHRAGVPTRGGVSPRFERECAPTEQSDHGFVSGLAWRRLEEGVCGLVFARGGVRSREVSDVCPRVGIPEGAGAESAEPCCGRAGPTEGQIDQRTLALDRGVLRSDLRGEAESLAAELELPRADRVGRDRPKRHRQVAILQLHPRAGDLELAAGRGAGVQREPQARPERDRRGLVTQHRAHRAEELDPGRGRPPLGRERERGTRQGEETRNAELGLAPARRAQSRELRVGDVDVAGRERSLEAGEGTRLDAREGGLLGSLGQRTRGQRGRDDQDDEQA